VASKSVGSSEYSFLADIGTTPFGPQHIGAGGRAAETRFSSHHANESSPRNFGGFAEKAFE